MKSARAKRRSLSLSNANRKGSVADGIPWLIGLFFAGIALPIVLLVVSNLNEGVQTLGDNHNSTKDQLRDLNSAAPSLFDGFFLTLFMGFFIVAVIFALTIRSSPSFLF